MYIYVQEHLLAFIYTFDMHIFNDILAIFLPLQHKLLFYFKIIYIFYNFSALTGSPTNTKGLK